MIRISLGKPGSGKTASEVRELFLNNNRKCYTNIMPKKPKLTPHVRTITWDMLANKEFVDEKQTKTKLVFNKDYWINITEPINVVIDEAHSVIDARRSMTTMNKIMGDWMALIRRVLGNSDSGEGELVLISQLYNRLDCIARDMCTQVRYHVCHFQKTCSNCSSTWQENSEMPEQRHRCPYCNSWNVKRHSFVIEVWKFPGMQAYLGWSEFGIKTYYSHYYINDIELYFPLYDTMQWQSMFGDLYD